MFMANRIDRTTGGDDWSRPLPDMVAVSIEPRRYGIPLVTPNVGLRKRLRLECPDGAVDLFVVNQGQDAVDRFRAATSSERRRFVPVVSSLRDGAGALLG